MRAGEEGAAEVKTAGTLLSEYEMERKTEVLSPLEKRPSSIAPNPEESRDGPPTPQYP